MNNLVKTLINNLVNIEDNNTNFTNMQNVTWKNPIQEQENRIEQIHQRFLKSQEWINKFSKQASILPNEFSHKRKKRKTDEMSSQPATLAPPFNESATEISAKTITGLTSIVATAGNSFIDSGVILNNKLYIGSLDYNLYEFDAITRQQKIIIKADKSFRNSGIVFNNKLYSNTNDGNLYEYNPITKQKNIVIKTESYFTSPGIILNNKLYIGSYDGKLYEYDPILQDQKIIMTVENDSLTVGIILNNKLYFRTYSGSLYEYDPITEQQKIIVIATNHFTSSGIIMNNKLYIGSYDGILYQYDPVTQQQKTVITATNHFTSSGIIMNNKLYIGSYDGKLYQYDPILQQQKIVATVKDDSLTVGIILNNKLYFRSYNGNLYEYDPVTQQQKIVIKAESHFTSAGITLNNKLYIASRNGNLYEYDPITQQQKIVIATLDELQDAGIIFNNKLYIRSYAGDLYEYDSFEEIENAILNVNTQIRRGLYLYYKKNEPNLNIKNIVNINLSNLNVTSISLAKNQVDSRNIKNRIQTNICPSIRGNLINKTNITQELYTAACEITVTTTYSTQKLNGFSLSTENSTSLESNWHINVNLGARASGEAWIPFVAAGKVETSLDVGTGGGESTTKTALSQKTKSEEKTKTKSSTREQKIQYPSQKVILPPYSKVRVSVIGEKLEQEFNLRINQEIKGNISATIIKWDNSKQKIMLSIKEIVLSLKEYNRLPSRISTNANESINFIYDTKITTEDIESNIIFNKIMPLENEKSQEVSDIERLPTCQTISNAKNEEITFDMEKINKINDSLPLTNQTLSSTSSL